MKPSVTLFLAALIAVAAYLFWKGASNLGESINNVADSAGKPFKYAGTLWDTVTSEVSGIWDSVFGNLSNPSSPDFSWQQTPDWYQTPRIDFLTPSAPFNPFTPPIVPAGKSTLSITDPQTGQTIYF